MGMWNLKRYRAFLLDVDGVLVHDSRPIPGATEAVRLLQKAARVLVLTNNSTRTRLQHARRLSEAGFDVHPEDIISSAFVAADYLFLHHGAVSVWPIGEQGLTDELLARGHKAANEPQQAQWVIAGMDRHITYQKLADGLQALHAGACFLATNQDTTYPTPEGLVPGAGAIVGALRGMGYEPQLTIGKPEPFTYAVALGMIECAPDRVLMVGDRLETDILGGNRCGIDTLLVQTGISRESDIETLGIPPTWLAESITSIHTGAVLPRRD